MDSSLIVLRHVAFEDLGTWEAVAERAGFRTTYMDVGSDVLRLDDDTDDLPAAVLDADLVVVLGAPVNANDTANYPYLGREVELIRRRLDAGAPVLGICLGAQLMSLALGGEVAATGAGMQIGWSPVDLTEEGRTHAVAELDGVPVMHWHGDSITLPEGATLLASDAHSDVQAFSTPGGLGIQFHPEFCWRHLENWLIGHQCDIEKEGIDRDALRSASAEHGPALIDASERMVFAWLRDLQVARH